MPAPPPGSVVAGCRIEQVVGRGGMGVVYLATQLSLQRPVALKLIAPELTTSPGFRERFKRESRLAASIEHPNVIPVYEAGEADGLLYLIMRYIEGTDLRAMLQDTGALEPDRGAGIVGQVAAALAAAHRRGLIHRDVKPANVLIDGTAGREHAYLTDFGIARDVGAQTALTQAGTVVGTLDYLAPERMQEGHGDVSSDVYALGCVLFEVLTGRVPFPHGSDVAKMYAHLNEPVPSPRELRPDVPEHLAELAAKAMAKDPQARFATADEMAEALARPAPSTEPAAPGAPLPPTELAAPPTELVPPRATPPPTAPPGPTAPAGPAPAPTGAAPAEPAVPGAAPTAARPPARAPARGRRTGLIAAVAGAVVVAAVVAVVLLAGGGSDEPGGTRISDQSQSGGGGSGRSEELGPLSPSALEPVDVGVGADGVAVGAGSVWVANKNSGTVTRLDPSSRRIEGTTDVGANPDSLAIGEGGIWVTNTDDNSISRIDPRTAQVADTIQVGAGPEGIAVGRGAVWVANSGDGTVSRVDPDGGRPRTTQVGTEPIQLAFDTNSVWVTVTGDSTVQQLDLESGERAADPVRVNGSPRGIAFADDLLWVSATKANQVVVIDPSSRRVVSRIDVPDNPREVRAGEGAVWVSCAQAGSVVAIDTGDRRVAAEVDVEGSPYGLAVGAGRVWAAGLDNGLITPIEPRG